jgi:hypothetical protein
MGPTTQVATLRPTGVRMLAAAMAADGAAVVAWRIDAQLFASVISADGVAAAAQLLTSSYSTWGGPPRIAADDRGGVAVAWAEGSPARPAVAFRGAGSASFSPPLFAAATTIDPESPQPIDVTLDPTSGATTVAFAGWGGGVDVARGQFGGPFGPAQEVLRSPMVWQVSARTSATGDVLVTAGHSDYSPTAPPPGQPPIDGVGTVSVGIAPASQAVPTLTDVQPVDYFYTPAAGPQGEVLIAFRDQHLATKDDALGATLIASNGSVTRDEPVTARWSTIGIGIDNPVAAFGPLSDALIAFDHDLTGYGSPLPIGELDIITHNVGTTGWCTPQPLAVGIPPYAPPALALNATGRGLLAWQASTDGIAAATVAPGAGCPASAIASAPVALAPISQLSQTLRSTLLGAACQTACKGTLRLIDAHDRLLASTRLAIQARSGRVIRVPLRQAARDQLRRLTELHTTASITLSRHRDIRIPLLLAR